MRYLLNPALPLHPAAPTDWRGNPIEDGEFQYFRDAFRPEWSKLGRFMLGFNPERAEKKADKWTPVVSQDVSYLEDRERDWIVWLGHACFLFQLDGRRYLTDPQLSDMPTVPRRFQLPFKIDELTGIDFLLLSHDHRDHVDEYSIRTICKNNFILKIFCPLGLTRVVKDWVGYATIEEAAWYQSYDFTDVRTSDRAPAPRITFLPARHWCRRGLTDFNRVLWGSFLIEQLDGGFQIKRKIYFGGDSARTPYWAEIGQRFPGIDLAMLGIGAYSPRFMMQDNHANPAEAFGGYRDLGAAYWWPMHHGTYDLSWEPASQPISWASKLMRDAGLEEQLVQPPVNQPWWFPED